MKKYLATLHQKSDSHKKRFALLTSGVVTLFIFSFWSLANFGVSGESDSTVVAKVDDSEVSPLESIRTNLATSIEALRNSFGEIKDGVGGVNLEDKYEAMRGNALDVYGQ